MVVEMPKPWKGYKNQKLCVCWLQGLWRGQGLCGGSPLRMEQTKAGSPGTGEEVGWEFDFWFFFSLSIRLYTHS